MTARNLLKTQSASVLVRGGGAGLTLIVGVILARILGPVDYGIYSFAISLATFMSVISVFGSSTLIVREFARYQAQEKWASMNGLWKRANQVVLTNCVFIGTIAAALAVFAPWHHARLEFSTLIWALILVPIMALTTIVGSALRGIGEVIRGQIPEQLLRPALLLVILFVSFFLLGFDVLVAVDAIQFQIIATCASLLVGWIFFATRATGVSRRSPVAFGDSPAWLRSVGPFGTLALFQVMLSQTDTIVLGMLVDPAQVGIYRVAWQGAGLVNLILFAIGLSVEPEVARLHAQGKQAQVQALVRTSGRVVFAISISILAGFVFIGEWLIDIVFAGEYAESYWPLLILSTGQVAFAASGWSTIVLNMTGNERIAAKLSGYAAGLNLILNLVLVPVYGIYGAAVATCIARFVWKYAMAIAANRVTGINTLVFAVARTRE